MRNLDFLHKAAIESALKTAYEKSQNPNLKTTCERLCFFAILSGKYLASNAVISDFIQDDIKTLSKMWNIYAYKIGSLDINLLEICFIAALENRLSENTQIEFYKELKAKYCKKP
ncbi:MAG: hypothetical protein PUB96_08735 [Helicobacteraceae bacterium]|nr:hypothetical protein [Helicobacteraceae bacterium]